jgi:Replication-relaxation
MVEIPVPAGFLGLRANRGDYWFFPCFYECASASGMAFLYPGPSALVLCGSSLWMLAGSSVCVLACLPLLVLLLPFSRVVALVITGVFGTEIEERFKYGWHRGRGGSLADRDKAILWGLHVARVMSTPQIAVELFPGQQACKARTRLNRLRALGLVERHRGGQPAGSEAFLWSLTRKGFERLRHWKEGWLAFGTHEDDPIPWLLAAEEKFQPWRWAQAQSWGSALPGRIAHDLAALDFLISYRRLVDALLAAQAGEGFVVSEWRCEHVFLPPLDERDHYGERRPVTVSRAVEEAFGYYRDHIFAGGFDYDARLQVVKPDGALSIVVVDPKDRTWRTIVEPAPWQAPCLFDEQSGPPHLLVDVLVEYDRTGRFSDNVEKLRGLDMFLNVGRRLVERTPVLCLGESGFHERYTAEVIVLFVCPPGKARTMMAGADRVLIGHLFHDGGFSYEGRKRIVFCESDAFGDLAADLRDHERWLRLPAGRRPAPPAPRAAGRRMWRLPPLPPPASRPTNPLTTWVHAGIPAPVRDSDALTPRPWKHPAMIEVLRRGA